MERELISLIALSEGNILSLENNFVDVSTECSSCRQGESERSANKRC